MPEDLQKQLAVLNKTKTCLSVPLLGSNILQWIYQEAVDGHWEFEQVFKVLEREETDEGMVVSARVKHLGEQIFKIFCCHIIILFQPTNFRAHTTLPKATRAMRLAGLT